MREGVPAVGEVMVGRVEKARERRAAAVKPPACSRARYSLVNLERAASSAYKTADSLGSQQAGRRYDPRLWSVDLTSCSSLLCMF